MRTERNAYRQVKSPYMSYHFWENQIQKKSVFEMVAEDTSVDQESLIVYLGFVDAEKDIFMSGWKEHANMQALIGYLVHVFYPMAYYNWMDRESLGFYIPMTPFRDMVSAVLETIPEAFRDSDEHTYGSALGEFREMTKSLAELQRQDALTSLREIERNFNRLFDHSPLRKMFIKIFGNAVEIPAFIFGDDEMEVFEEVVEEAMGMNLKTFEKFCESAYKEPFVSKIFIKRLNQDVPICF